MINSGYGVFLISYLEIVFPAYQGSLSHICLYQKSSGKKLQFKIDSFVKGNMENHVEVSLDGVSYLSPNKHEG